MDEVRHNTTIIETYFFDSNFPHFDHESQNTFLDAKVELIARIVFYIILSSTISAFGIFSNIVSLVIFVRQGLFSGGSIISLFGLALADLGVVFTNLLHGIGFGIIVADIPNLDFDPFAVLYLALGWPHTIFVSINRMLTAYIAFERCMCVVRPFRVQSLFTPKKSLVYIIVIFVYSFLSHVPIYLTHSLEFHPQEGTNTSILVLTFGPHRDIIHDVVYYTNYFVVSFASVLIVAVCTIVTSIKVNTAKQWRQSVSACTSVNLKRNKDQRQGSNVVGERSNGRCNSETERSFPAVNVNVNKANSDNKDNLHSKNGAKANPVVTCEVAQSNVLPSNVGLDCSSSRDDKTICRGIQNKVSSGTKAIQDKEARLIKMITVISMIFLLCFVPDMCLIVMKWLDDRVRTNGQFHRLAHLLYSIIFVFGSVNSSINILVYYHMASGYRMQFTTLFSISNKR